MFYKQLKQLNINKENQIGFESITLFDAYNKMFPTQIEATNPINLMNLVKRFHVIENEQISFGKSLYFYLNQLGQKSTQI